MRASLTRCVKGEGAAIKEERERKREREMNKDERAIVDSGKRLLEVVVVGR